MAIKLSLTNLQTGRTDVESVAAMARRLGISKTKLFRMRKDCVTMYKSFAIGYDTVIHKQTNGHSKENMPKGMKRAQNALKSI